MSLLSRVKESIVQYIVEQETEYRPIKSITHKSDNECVYNFSTPLHTYCVNGDIVVHNCDTISMLGSLTAWKPSEDIPLKNDIQTSIWELDIPEERNYISSYIV